MSVASKPPQRAKSAHVGPIDWRSLVEWLRTDGVIADDEAQRTIARCASRSLTPTDTQRHFGVRAMPGFPGAAMIASTKGVL